MASAELVGQST